MAIWSFRNKATEDINYGRVTKDNLKLLPKALHEKAQVKLARLSAATSLNDLRELRGNRLEVWFYVEIGKGSIVSELTINIEFAFDGKMRIFMM